MTTKDTLADMEPEETLAQYADRVRLERDRSQGDLKRAETALLFAQREAAELRAEVERMCDENESLYQIMKTAEWRGVRKAEEAATEHMRGGDTQALHERIRELEAEVERLRKPPAPAVPEPIDSDCAEDEYCVLPGQSATFADGWNACIDAMLAAAPKPEDTP